jgi:soluble lytic murein transglycosylase
MQLMPNTAVRAAKEIPLDLDLDEVWQPDVNLQLGSFYLSKLLKNFKGIVPLAAAGYNAGPVAVQRWLASGKDRDLDVWVSRIPYRETRHYVQRVVTNLARYQYLSSGRESVMKLPLTIPADTKIDDDAY